MIRHEGPWRDVDHVEHATASWVDWYNHHRLYQYGGNIPPAQLEAHHYSHTQAPTEAA